MKTPINDFNGKSTHRRGFGAAGADVASSCYRALCLVASLALASAEIYSSLQTTGTLLVDCFNQHLSFFWHIVTSLHRRCAVVPRRRRDVWQVKKKVKGIGKKR